MAEFGVRENNKEKELNHQHQDFFWYGMGKLTGQLCSEKDPPMESCDRDGVGEDFSEYLGSIPDLTRSSSVWTSLIRLSRSLSCWTRATFFRCSPTRTLLSFSRLASRISWKRSMLLINVLLSRALKICCDNLKEHIVKYFLQRKWLLAQVLGHRFCKIKYVCAR